MPKKILLADDSLTIQKVVELTFSEEDYEVTVVGDGAQAIERITAEPPDIVLADVMMPKKTGYEVCEFVKKAALTQHVPVLLLVGKFEPFDQDRATRVGADGHILKPFESNVLVRSVTELLAAAAAKAPAPVAAPALAPSIPEPPLEATLAPAASAAFADPPFESTAPFGEDAQASDFGDMASEVLPGDPLTSGDWSTPSASMAERPHGSSTAQLDRPDLGLTPLGTPFTPLPPPSDTLDDPFAQTPSGAFAADFADGRDVDAPFGEPEAAAPPPKPVPVPVPVSAPPAEEPVPRVETRAMSVPAVESAPVEALGEIPAREPSLGLPLAAGSLGALPEDVMNAIVARVVKHLSDDVVREIAWQVVPELAELLIKKKLEELG